MGLMVDTNVFISFEKKGDAIDLSPWDSQQEICISVVTVSELLIGVHRADSEVRRVRRASFVEAVIANMHVLNVDMSVARVHSELYAKLATKGLSIGAHDLLIAATAIHWNHTLLTDNVDEFSRVPGLHVVSFK